MIRNIINLREMKNNYPERNEMKNNYLQKWLVDTEARIVRRDIEEALKSTTRSELKAFVKVRNWRLEEVNGQFVVYK
jgi:hypothetical protein